MNPYRQIDDLPGDPLDPEYGLIALRSVHDAAAIDDVTVNGAECILSRDGEVVGILRTDLMGAWAGRA